MEFLQSAAGKYLQSQGGDGSKPSEGGLDWSNLANLASKYYDADNSTDGDLDADTFKQHLYGEGKGGKKHHRKEDEGYGQQESYGGYGDRPQETGYGRQEEGRYEGRPQQGEYGGYGRPQEGGGYGRRPEEGGGGYGGYGGRPDDASYGGRPQDSSYGRPQEQAYGRPSSYDRPEGGFDRPHGGGSGYDRPHGGGGGDGGYDRPGRQEYDRPDQSYGGGYDRPQYSEHEERPKKHHSEYSGGGEYDRPQGRPPPGYPSGEGGGHASKPSGGAGHSAPADANPDILHQLMSAYSSHTGGEQFTGGSGQYEVLAQLASKLTGQKIPAPMLEKLIKWKLNGLV